MKRTKEEEWKRDADRDILGEGAIQVPYGKKHPFFFFLFYYLSYKIMKIPLPFFFLFLIGLWRHISTHQNLYYRLGEASIRIIINQCRFGYAGI